MSVNSVYHTLHSVAAVPRRTAPGVALTLTLTLIAGAAPVPSWAALGDAEASVAQDMASMKASRRIAVSGNYTTHELRTVEGTTIREFVSSGGVVFAVSWHGPFKPSMRMLLGAHFDQYGNAPQTSDSSRSRMKIEQPNLIVRSSGHMRSFSGVAFLPQWLPAGVTEQDLK